MKNPASLVLGCVAFLAVNLLWDLPPSRVFPPVIPAAPPSPPPAASTVRPASLPTPTALPPAGPAWRTLPDAAAAPPILPRLFVPFAAAYSVQTIQLEAAAIASAARLSAQRPVPTFQPAAPAARPTPSTSPASLDMIRFYHSQRSETLTSNACGPASLLIALDYFRIPAGSLDKVIQAVRLEPARGGFDPTCTANPACLSAGVLARVAHEKYGLSVEAHTGWTFEQLYAALAGGRPVIADITWGLVPGGYGHFVLVYGADPAHRIVYYHDPYAGPSRSSSWDAFSASWNGPVDVGDPLAPAGLHAWGVALSLP